jgi:hypothetical protein
LIEQDTIRVKILHLGIIAGIVVIFLFSDIMLLPAAQGTTGYAFFMKSNSTGQIYTDYTFRELSNQTWNFMPEILASIHDSNPLAPKDLIITAFPETIIKNKNNTSVTYSIMAKNNVKGVYALSLFSCGLTPLVVGLNESQVSPAIFNDFFSAQYNCPAMTGSTPDLNIVGYSGIISKIISINPDNTNITSSVNQLEISSPLKQFKSGIATQDVKCEQGLQLIIKSEDGSPACVTTNTATALMERGWTLPYSPNPDHN